MSVVAVIPARGGSKGVPGKNLQRVGGIPLITRAIAAAVSSRLIDRVLVSTDDPAIARTAIAAGAEVVDRPPALSGDEASSESALFHALDSLEADPEITVFLQATSPFIGPLDLDSAIARVRDGDEDVVFSAVESHGFLWSLAEGGAVGVNHDHRSRARRQDREPHYLETGAFYVMRSAGFRAIGHRFFGRIGVTLVEPRTAIEIDSPEELEVAAVLAGLIDSAAWPGPIEVEAVVTDFDGVHTDDRVLVAADGSEYVMASRSDGMGVRRLREAGYPLLILSAEANPVVAARAAKLGAEVLQGVRTKSAALIRWAEDRGIRLDRVAYLGNDLNDLGCMAIVGWPVAVPGSAPEVIAAARVVLDTPGGYGAVRELADLVLRSSRSHHEERERDAWPSQSAAPL